MAQAILADTFPPRLRGLAFSLYGITAIFAPSIGPTLGGWDYGQLHLAVDFFDEFAGRYPGVDPGPATGWRIHRTWPGPALRASVHRSTMSASRCSRWALARCRFCSTKGKEDDWFGSHFIVTLMIVAGVCLTSLVVGELFQKYPIVDVRLFGHFNFATSSVMMFVVGGMSFATTVLVPQFLQANMGYTAESAGMVLSAAGFVLLAALPFIGMLAGRYQGRYLIATGWLLLTSSRWLSTRAY